MRRLMLLRHAKTENDAPSGRDLDRRLDNRGRGDAAEIGGWIARHPPFADSVLVSHAVRAQQTWDIAWEAMKDLVPEPGSRLCRNSTAPIPRNCCKPYARHPPLIRSGWC